MVAVVNGSGLGLKTSLVPTQTNVGSSTQGQNPEAVFVNTDTGNLVIQDREESLSAVGLDLSLIRTYNSQGLLDDPSANNWRLGVMERLLGLTGTVNTTGSTITKEFGDGAEVVYTYNSSLGLYVAALGTGAHDTLAFNSSSSRWTWTSGAARNTETYSSSGQLLNSKDVDGNTRTYSYTGGLLTSISDASGQTTYLDYTGNNLTQIRVVSNGQTQTLTHYGYDGQNRLTTVTVDLSPADNSISDGNTYATTYTYEGTSTRVASITQGDGTTVSFTYVQQDGAYRLHTYTDGDGKVTTFSYSSPSAAAGSGSISVNANSAVLSTSSSPQTYNLNSSGLSTTDTVNRIYDLNPGLLSSGITYVQGSWNSPGTNPNSNVSATFSASNQVAGDTNIVAIAWNDATSHIASVTDTAGNVYTLAVGPTTSPGNGTQAIYYARNIVAAAAGDNTVTVTFDNGNVLYPDIRIAEYGGIDPTNPFDVGRGASGNGTANDSGSVTTTNAKDLLVGANYVEHGTPGPGDGYLLEMLTNNSSIFEDQTVTSAGSYNATAPQDISGWWIIQVAAFRAADAGPPHYTVRSGDTWQSIANALYGISAAAAGAALQTAMGNPTLTPGAQLANFPATISVPTQVTVAAYYAVQSGDTWQSIANSLYGVNSAVAGAALQAAMGNPTLTAGLHLAGLPSTLSVGGTTQTYNINAAALSGGGTAVPSYVQGAFNSPAASPDSLSATYTSAQTAGDLNVIAIAWSDDTSTITSVTDSAGNTYTLAVGPTSSSGNASQSIYYAKNIHAAAAGSNTVTVTFSGVVPYPDLRIAEYSGLDTTSPLDIARGSAGNSTATSSAPITTISANDLIIGANYVYHSTVGPGAGFTQRLMSDAQSIFEDREVTATGTYSATAPQSPSGWWVMQVAAFEAQTIASYYVVPAGATWQSIANTLYGINSTDAGAALQAATGNPTLSTGLHLTGLPARLSVSTGGTGPAYYLVPAGATWASITQAVYGTSDTNAIAALQAATGNPTLTTGLHLVVPATLTYSGSTSTGNTLYLRTDVTDGTGQLTSFVEDSSGRLTSFLSPAVSGTTQLRTDYTYDTDGNILTVTQDAGGLNRVTTMTYDTNGNLISSRDTDGNTITHTFDSANQLLTETHYLVPDPDGPGTGQPSSPITTRYAYDSNEQLRFVVSPDGRVTEYQYRNGTTGERTSAIKYDGAIDDVSALAPNASLSESALMSWAASQDLTKIERTDYTYDFRGNVSTATAYTSTDSTGAGVSGSGSVTQYVYDQRGQLLQTVDPRGSGTAANAANSNIPYATTLTYDGLGRIGNSTQWTASGSTSSTLTTYDSVNNKVVTTYANSLVQTSVYDHSGHLLSVSHSGPGITGSSTTTYAYDADGRLRMTTDPDGVRTYVIYDEAGRKVGDIDGSGALTRYLYNNDSQLVKAVRYADPLTATTLATLVDAQGNPANVSIATLVAAVPTTVGRTFDQITRNVYDAAGLKVYSVDAAGDLTKFVYDGAGRLTDQIQYANAVSIAASVNEVLPSAINAPTDPVHDRRTRYFYDNDGNLRGVLDAQGYLTEYTYDAGGHLTRKMAYATQSPSAYLTTGTLAQLIPALDDDAVMTPAEDATTYYFYDGEGRQIGEFQRALTDPAGTGYLTETQYDSAGNVQTLIRYDRGLTYTVGSSTFSSLKAAAAAAGAAPQTTSYQYDGAGRVTQETNYEGTITSYSYDSVGNLLSETVAYGQNTVPNDTRTTQERYDALGRVTQELSATGSAQVTIGMTQAQIDAIWNQYGVTYTYDADGRKISATTHPYDQIAGTSQTNTTYYYYDADGNLRFTVDATGAVAESRYNALGQVSDQITYATRLNSSQLTGLIGGLLTTTVQSTLTSVANSTLDTHSTYTYNLAGEVATGSSAEGSYVTHGYDAFGDETTRTEKVDGTRTLTHSYQYDGLGHQTVVQWDPSGINRTQTTAYDAFGRVASVTDQYGNQTRTRYDRLGRVIATFDALGNPSSTAGYDAFSRVYQTTDALLNTTTYTYNDANRSVVMTTPEGISVTTVHNRNGQTLTVSTKGPDNVTLNTTTYSYDLNGDLTGTSDNLGTLESRVYDSNGRELTSTDARNVVTRFTYDAVNRVLTQTVDNAGLALVTSYQYNTAGQVTQVSAPGGKVTATAYDRDGRISTVTVDPTGVNPSGLNLVTKYAYDNAGDEITVTQGYGSTHPQVIQYNYDVLGRRTQQIVDPGSGTNPSTGQPYLNLTTNYKYDANGNLTRKIDAVGNSVWFVYDADSHPIYTVDALGEVTQSRYDGDGRVASTTRYLNTVSTAGFGDVVTSVTVTAAPLSDQFVQTVYDRDGRERYTIDAAGAVTERTFDAAGNVTQRRRYANVVAAGTYASVSAVTNALTTAGNNTTTISSNDRVTWGAYDARGNALFQVDGTGYVVASTFDGAGNVVASTAYATQRSTTLPMDLSSLQSWSAQTAVATASDNRTTRYWYDGAGRQVFKLDAEGYLTETRYNDAQRTTSVILYTSKPTVAANAATADVRANSVVTGFNATRDHVSSTDQDAAGRVIRTYDALTLATAATWEEYAYDAVGNRISVVDPRGIELATTNTPWAQSQRSSLGYSANAASLTSAQQAALKALYTTQYAFDAAGREITVTDALSNVTHKQYDGLGNLVKVTDPRGGVGYTYYDAVGRARYQVDPNGYVTEKRYDALGNNTDEYSYAHVLTGTYDQSTTLAQLAALITPNLDVLNDRRRNWTYDQRGMAKVITYYSVTNYTEKFDYNTFGDKADYTDRDNSFFQYQYDAGDRLILETDPAVNVVTAVLPTLQSQSMQLQTKYEYNAFGDLAYKREAYGTAQERDTHHVYDHLGRETRVESPSFSVFDPVAKTSTTQTPAVQKSYDAAGNLILEIAANGGRTVNYYDTRNMLVASVNADDALTEYQYDSVGNLIDEKSYDTRLSGVQDPASRPAPVNPAANREVSYTYNANNLRTVTQTRAETLFSWALQQQSQNPYYSGPVVTLASYDANGNVVRTQDGNGYATYQYYDAKGDRVLQVDAAGFVTRWEYNAQGQVTRQTQYAAALLSTFRSTLSATTSAQAILAAVPATTTTTGNNRVTEYVYDQLGRMTIQREVGVTYSGVNATTGALTQTTGNLETSYQYDGNGNRTAMIKPNSQGRTDYQYDALGRMIQELEPTFQAFNGRGQATVSTRSQTNMQYDAAGNLVDRLQLGMTTAENRDVRSQYDSAGNLRAQQDAEGAQISDDYDIAGNVLRTSRQVTDVDGVAHTYCTYHVYDVLNRETSSQDIDDEGSGSQVVHETHDTQYNAHGDVQGKGFNGQYQEKYLYDGLGRLFWTNRGNGTPRVYIHDANGNAVVEVDALNTDLSTVTVGGVTRAILPSDVPGLAVNSDVQFTLSVYDPMNRLIKTYQSPMIYGDLLSSAPTTQQTGTPPSETTGAVTPTTSPLGTGVSLVSGPTVQTTPGTVSSTATGSGFGTPPADSHPAGVDQSVSSTTYTGQAPGTYTSDTSSTQTISDVTSSDGLTRTVREQLTQVHTVTVIEQLTSPPADAPSTPVPSVRWTQTVTTDVTTRDTTFVLSSGTSIYGSDQQSLTTPWTATRTAVVSTNRTINQTVKVYESKLYTDVTSAYDGTSSTVSSVAFDNAPVVGIQAWAYDRGGQYYPENWSDAIVSVSLDIPAITSYGGGPISVDVTGTGVSGTYSVPTGGGQISVLSGWDSGIPYPPDVSYHLVIHKGGVVIATTDVGVSAGANVANSDAVWLNSIICVRGQPAAAATAWVRVQNTDGTWGSWMSAGPTNIAGSGPEFLFSGAWGSGRAFEYQVLDSSGHMLNWATSSLGSGSQADHYTTTTRTHTDQIVTTTVNGGSYSGSNNAPLNQTQSNYIKNLFMNLTQGAANSHIIVRSQSYDAFGDVIAQVDGNNNETDFQYDNLGDMIAWIQPTTDVYPETGSSVRLRPTTRNYYDELGGLVATQDADSTQLPTAQQYFNTRVLVNGRLVKEFDPYGHTITHVYDVLGNERQRFDQLNLETDQTLDRDGRLLRVDRYDGSGTLYNFDSYQYDQAGNRIAHTNGLNNRETDLFDGQNRDRRHTSFEGRQTFYDYSYVATIGGVGGFQKQTRTTGTSGQDTATDQIDYFGHLRFHQDIGGHQFNYYYNNAGWLKQQTGATSTSSRNAQNITYTYYGNGLLEAVDDTGISSHSLFQYDNNGNRIMEAYSQVPMAAGTQSVVPYEVLTAQYDELNRVKHVAQAGLYDLTYTYDAVGNRRSMTSTYTDPLTGLSQPTQAFYYAYDHLNRFVITMGTHDSNGNIAIGNTGYQIVYDADGRRQDVYSNLLNSSGQPQYDHENYTYDPTGTLRDVYVYNGSGTLLDHSQRQNDAVGELIDYYDYNGSGSVVNYTHYSYDRDSLTTMQEDRTNPNARNRTTYTYNPGSYVLNQETANTVDANGIQVSGNIPVTLTYTYEKWDTYKNSVVTISASAHGWQAGSSTYQYDSNGHISQLFDSQANRSIGYVNDQDGLVLRRWQIQHVQNAADQPLVLRDFFILNGIVIGDVGTDKVPSRVDYAQALATEQKDGKQLFPEIGDRVFPVTSADFDQNYQPINPNYPPLAPQSHVVNAGETLQSIALAVWGDASLWYVIADANGLMGTETLVPGTRLTIPNVVTNIHNNAQTFRPYDPTLALGDTTPTLPAPPPPPMNIDGGCGVVGMILLVVVAIVVAVYTAGTLAPEEGSALGGAGGAAAGSAEGATAATAAGSATAGTAAAGTAAGTTAVATTGAVAGSTAGSLWSAGVAVLTGQAGFSAAAIGAAVVGGAVGSAVSQGVGIALGLQSGFDWKGVALAGISAGVTAGLGAAIGSGTSSFATSLRTLETEHALEYAALHGAVSSALTQGISVATGLQNRFDWREVGVTAVAEPVAQAVGNEAVKLTNAIGPEADFVNRFSSGVGGALVRRAFDNGVDLESDTAGAFAQALVFSVGTGAEAARSRVPVASQDDVPEVVVTATRTATDQLGTSSASDTQSSDVAGANEGGDAQAAPAAAGGVQPASDGSGNADFAGKIFSYNHNGDPIYYTGTGAVVKGAMTPTPDRSGLYDGPNEEPDGIPLQAYQDAAGNKAFGFEQDGVMHYFRMVPPPVEANTNASSLGITESQVDARMAAGKTGAGYAALYALGVTGYEFWNFLTVGFVKRHDDRLTALANGRLSESNFWMATGADAVGSVGSLYLGGRVGSAVLNRLGSGYAGYALSGAAGAGAFDLTQQGTQMGIYALTGGQTGQQQFNGRELALATGGGAVLGTATKFVGDFGNYDLRSPVVAVGRAEMGMFGIKGFQFPLVAPSAPGVDLVAQLGLPRTAQRALLRAALGAGPGVPDVAHHLVPLEAINRFPNLMRQAAAGGFNINGANNGALLDLSEHVYNHPQYNQEVLRKLGTLDTEAPAADVAKQLQSVADILRKALNAGTFGPWG